ncbi:MAG: DUF3365 domain-containing protein [Gammaproteobacteria bacterium]|nr:MAG: DUF3365 domain-containing protein [Gammaproteobacteria bacterium]
MAKTVDADIKVGVVHTTINQRGYYMKKCFLPFLLMGFTALPALADPATDRVAASRGAVKELQTTLVGELQAAMKAGGPTNAIEVCNTKASAIATELSKKNGLQIGRTSLKIRNAKNAPDAWETKVMKEFETRKAKGEDPAALEHSEVVTEGGKKTFRYMKALPVAQGMPCPVCHGEKIDPKVRAKLEKLYPQDKAVGFKVGDLRGAVTIKQPL